MKNYYKIKKEKDLNIHRDIDILYKLLNKYFVIKQNMASRLLKVT